MSAITRSAFVYFHGVMNERLAARGEKGIGLVEGCFHYIEAVERAVDRVVMERGEARTADWRRKNRPKLAKDGKSNVVSIY